MIFFVFPKKSNYLMHLLLLFFSAFALPAIAQNHIVERAWLEDPSGVLSWSEVQKLPMQPYEGILSRGFGSSRLWIKLRIDPWAHPVSAREPEKLVLRIRPVYLDDIQIFDPLMAEQPAGQTGDLHHPRGHVFEGLDFMLPIARGDAPRDVWLMVQSTSTRQIAVEAVNVDNLTRLVHTQELLYALYIGVIIVFVAWALMYWLFSREHLVGAFALSQLVALFYALCSLGYARAFWPAFLSAEVLDVITSLFSILAVSAAVFFHVLHISEFAPPRWARLCMYALLGMSPIKLLLLGLNQPMLALHLNMLEILVAPTLFLAIICLAQGWQRHAPGRPPALRRAYVIGFYILLWLLLLVAVLPGLALSAGGEIPLYIVQAHGLVTATLILLMLQYRDRVRRQQQNQVALALERSQMQALQEKSIREEQEKLLAMLAHEIKTPLATMQMRLNSQAQGSREIRQAIRDMDGVIERCIQASQLSDRQLQPQTSRVDLVDMLRDVVSSSGHAERIELEAPARLMVDTDRQLLYIAINNLLENACKYAAPQSSVRLCLSKQLDGDLDMASIEVSNLPGSAGYPDPDKLFQKYYRSPNARRQAGTGLGLYLVSSLMAVLGGRIAYLPDDQRVRFVLSLPVTPTD